ncbi:energy-coupling factor transporter ATPase [Tumebacillus sp. DT12]|uniref:Energy-coupling factor transporter ATPase n=1 Tax=Tumebacillus lacus TaxID=2995335 RepID=A0ABT3X0X3_9BACL|nr:ABC transporter ATP-binding protein [Tumebacillus lacus]MCX7570573.1 energy-coupling factor transporter ATPase [Tumebacillus lacus]
MTRYDLQLEQFTYRYPDAPRLTLDRIDWQVERGEFVLLAGPSGCGKSTLLRALNGLVPEFYGGEIGGRALFRGRPLAEFPNRSIARHVGMVFQDPEKQLVMSEVEREIAFGLENLLVPESEMRRRVAEVMSFFDLTALRHRATADLSGGEKQKVAIAAVMALQPDVLLLDEPTSQLDPGAAQEILDLIKRMNEELGLTVVLVEQRLDRVLHLADRIVAMHEGRIDYDGEPQGFARYASEQRPELLPPVTKLFADAGRPERPLTVKAARQTVASLAGVRPAADPNGGESDKRSLSRFFRNVRRMFRGGESEGAMFEARDVRYAYPDGEEVLKGLDLDILPGRLTAILGPNGAGKSTMLRHLIALLKPQEGRVRIDGQETSCLDPADLAGKVGYLSQYPADYLFHETLRAECEFSRRLIGLPVGTEEAEREIDAVLDGLGLLAARDRNPRDLSGGERQRAALATVLVQRPDALLLDEPTRGLDSGQKDRLGAWLSRFVEDGGTVILITHDVEFAAEYAQEVVLLDDGEAVAHGAPQEMLARGLFFAPQTGRVFRGVDDRIVRLADGVAALRNLAGEEESR